MSDSPLHLHVSGLWKVFDGPQGALPVLAGIDLQVRRGEFVCLLGPSGCGKSTLLRVVAGFEAASGGSVLVEGRPVKGAGPDRGMVFQDYGLFPWLTVRDNVGFGLRQRRVPRAVLREKVDAFLAMMGLSAFAESHPHQLSGGMKQRVSIARVLANGAGMLLMDEPFAALDAMTRERLQSELLGIWEREKVTVLFVTHSVEEAVMLGDRVVVLQPHPGRVAADVAIDLPRPRDPMSAEFNAVRRRMTEELARVSAPRGAEPAAA
ncbi:ABC transporter ATP-binding protein [Roseomonas sp. OT10]|uniref:ABC transporter ATP-binding protein n=1 Tax=Roseomonas cutis TaxID=2897332 RepID=UPI001E6172BC|nr:ABC transporter ATP-binding protein [Roseomonas sp. OT10]UFN49699.1 ABC transporter ATP-binding protein [Roseomonas sp. OT10]